MATDKHERQPSARPAPNGKATLRVPQPLGELHFSHQAKVWTVAILVALLIIFVLRVFPILVPFLWALVVAYLCNGLINWLMARTKAPRWVWVAFLFLLIVAVIGIGVAVLVPAITSEVRQLQTDIPTIRAQVDRTLGENETVAVGPLTLPSDTVKSAIDSLTTELPRRLQELAPEVLGRAFETILKIIIFFVAAFYLTLWGGRPIFRFIDRLPIGYRAEMRGLVLRIDRVLTAYIRSQFLLIIIMSVATSTALTILNVRYAIILGIATGFLELIPFVGPYSATAIAVAVAYFQGNTPPFGLSHDALAIVVLATYLILRQIEDYVVVPLLVGRVVHINPLVVIIAVLAGESILGPIGLLLAVPLTAMLRIIVGYLFYKVVDADRTLIDVQADIAIGTLVNNLVAHTNERVLLNMTDSGHVLFTDANLRRIQNISRDRNIDVAICCADEHDAEKVRDYGIPIVDRPTTALG